MARPDTTTLTRSRRLDLLVFVAILALMLLLAPRLRVYFRVTVANVVLERVTPDGQRTRLETPPAFDRPGSGYWRGASLVRMLTPAIDRYMQTSPEATSAQPGTRFEWTIRWADDSPRFDHSEQVVREVHDNR